MNKISFAIPKQNQNQKSNPNKDKIAHKNSLEVTTQHKNIKSIKNITDYKKLAPNVYIFSNV